MKITRKLRVVAKFILINKMMYSTKVYLLVKIRNINNMNIEFTLSYIQIF